MHRIPEKFDTSDYALCTTPEKMSPLYLVKCWTRSRAWSCFHQKVDSFENNRLLCSTGIEFQTSNIKICAPLFAWRYELI